MSETKTAWEILARPPKSALKQIKGGRLSGMTDINPQWRYKAMTDVFGQCGNGWKYEIQRTWTEQGTSGQVFMFAQVAVYTSFNGEWSAPIPGIGGSMLLETQKGQLHHNDEAVKMAVTDALSVALKMIGVGSDIYMGRWDGSKYRDDPQTPAEQMASAASAKGVTPTAGAMEHMDDAQRKFISEFAEGIQQHFNDGTATPAELVSMFEERHLDAEEKVAVWSLLDSKVRSAIKKAHEVAKVADSVAGQA